jgi:glycosyltransferase involved in cell wall biosynthesis
MEFGGLKVLMISTDRNILSDGSAVSERMKEYGALVEELHIVVMSDSSHGLKEKQLSKNVWIYPTSSLFKAMRPKKAADLGKKIVLDRKFVRGKSLVTTQDPFECGMAGLEVKKKWRLPLEVQLHTDPFSSYFNGVLNTVRRRIAEDVLRQADSVRVVSQSLADEVSKRFNLKEDKLSVLPIYVDRKRIEDAKVSFDLHARLGWHFIMLAVARLTPEKNLGQAIRILGRVREFFPDTGLVIVGDGPERGSLESLAKSLGVSHAVSFVGWQEDMASYYKTANLFIQTSRFEGYGLALVEAGLSGVPVVTTSVGIANELENGVDAIICTQDDEEYMFKAVYDLIKDNARRDIMRMHLRRTLEDKLLTKEVYLGKLKANWEMVSNRVKE